MEQYLENSLKEALLGNSASLRKRAIEVIRRTKLDSRSVIEALLGVAFYDADSIIRSSATSALVMIGGSCVIKVLGEILEQDEFETRKDESSHLAAVTLLLLIHSRESISILAKVLLDQGKDAVVRRFAIKALGTIGDPSIIQNLVDHWSVSTSLKDWLLEGICVETILALGKLGIQDLEDEIIAIIKNSTSSDTRKEAIEVLGRFLTEKAINYLHEALTDPDFSVRFSAALTLAEQNDVDSLPILIEALGKRDSIGFEDSTVCENAINALCEIGQEALERLEYALNDQDFQVKRYAELAISKIKGEAAPIDDLDVAVNQSADDYADTLINQLTSKYNFVELLHLLSAASCDEAWKFSSALMKISQPEQISLLLRFILNSDSNNVFYYVPEIISTIQNRCKVYNYETFQAAIQDQEQANLVRQTTPPSPTHLLAKIDRTTQQIDQRTQQMANEPKNNFGGATFSGSVNFGDNPTGDFIGTQNNYAADPEVQGAIADLQTLLTQLQSQHPQVTTETEALTILDAEFTEIKQSKTHRLATLRKQLLNPERHLQATKAALGEIAKHYLEESVWAKTLLTYLDKLSEDPNQGA